MKSQSNTNFATKSLLDAVYKNVKMGSESIIDLIPKVSDQNMRDELTKQLEAYDSFAKEIKNALLSIGEEAKEEGFFTKLSTKMGVTMNTMVDATSSHIAEMMIQGATMGVTDATKALREYENACSEDAMALAKQVIKFEEDSIEKLKDFL